MQCGLTFSYGRQLKENHLIQMIKEKSLIVGWVEIMHQLRRCHKKRLSQRYTSEYDGVRPVHIVTWPTNWHACNLKCQGYGSLGKIEDLLHIWENTFQVGSSHISRRYLGNKLNSGLRVDGNDKFM